MLKRSKRLALIGSLLVTALVCGAAAWAEDVAAGNGSVATVNGQAIDAKEYAINVNMMKQQYVQRGGTLDEKAIKNIEQQALERLIDQELLYQESDKAGTRVEKTEVDNHLAGFRQRFPNEAAFKKALQERDLTENQLTEQIVKGLAIQKFVQERFADITAVEEREIRQFYDGNSHLFQEPETVKASHILIKVESGATEAQKAAARKKIEEIQLKLKEGAAFDALAREYSEGPSSTNGGDLGFFKRGQMVPPFENAAFSLKPGGVSEMVVTQFGYHLIKVEDKKTGGAVGYETAKDKILNHLKQKKTGQAVQAYLKAAKVDAEITMGN